MTSQLEPSTALRERARNVALGEAVPWVPPPPTVTAGGPGSGRYPKGSGKKRSKSYPALSRSQFSNPDTPRTRKVTSDQFQELAARGEARLASFAENASPPEGLDRNWETIKQGSSVGGT